MTIRQCIAWRFCSSKGYEFPRNVLLKLPCKTTLKKYFGTDNENLIKNRLMCEIKTLNAPERICSLIVDDMAVRKALYYSNRKQLDVTPLLPINFFVLLFMDFQQNLLYLQVIIFIKI
jgi:hypothetical protein